MKVDIDKVKRRYHVIYADPPYMFRNKKTGGGMKSGSSSKYLTMTTDEICRLPIRKISQDDTVLFLWVPVPMIHDGLRIMEEWGYKYKTGLFWRKAGSGGWGFWYRGEIEILLFGIKGKVKAFRSKRTNFIEHKRMGHSVKPDIFREIIEESTIQFGKNRKMIELFARRHEQKKFYQKKWDYYGSQFK